MSNSLKSYPNREKDFENTTCNNSELITSLKIKTNIYKKKKKIPGWMEKLLVEAEPNPKACWG